MCGKLKRTHRLWKRAGKLLDKKSQAWVNYAEARSNLQRTSRAEYNQKTMSLNNTLMNASNHDRNKVYSLLRNLRNEGRKSATSTLESPAGTFYGEDILEGFAADAEHLGKPTEPNDYFDREFYELCILDNLYIFDFKGENPVKIPNMTMEDLELILNKKMKLKKACDIYQLTVEHLRYCGRSAKLSILTSLTVSSTTSTI